MSEWFDPWTEPVMNARRPIATLALALAALTLTLATPGPATATANLRPWPRGNWSAPIVPRYHLVGSTFFDPVGFEALYGDSDCVYLYTAVGNDGPDDVLGGVTNYYKVDGAIVQQESGLATIPAGLSVAYLSCLGAIRAGLHTIASIVDGPAWTAETNELDNIYALQVAMIPRPVAPGQVVFRSTPPDPAAGQSDLGGNPPPNQDGVRLPAISPALGTWSALAMRYATSPDYDLRLYDASTSSDNGFRTPLVASDSRTAGATEAVFVNHAITGSRAKDVGILRVNGTNTFAIEHRTSATGAAPIALNTTVHHGFVQDQMVAVEEFVHTPTAGMPSLRVTLQGPAALPVQLTWAYGDSVASRTSLAFRTVTTDYVTGLATVNIPVPTTGASQVLGLFLVRDASNAGTSPFPYSLKVESKPNLANVAQSGWLAPVGVGNGSASLSAEPATLTAGNSISGAFGWANDGNHDASAYTYRVFVDGSQVIEKTGNTLATGTIATAVVNIGAVAGGRHTVSSSLDVAGALAEFDESDNRFGKQWVWTPPALGTFAAMPAPPDPQGGWADMPAAAVKRDNLAAMRVSYSLAGTNRFGATFMMPGAGTDNSLAWYVPGGPTDGLQTLVQSTQQGGDRTEALFARGVVASYDAAVKRESGSAGYSMASVTSTVLGTLPLTSGTLSIPANRIGVIHALQLPTLAGPGGELQVLLENLAGNADLALALIPASGGPTFDLASLPAASKADAAGAGAGEELAAGHFAWDGSQVGLVVYKTSAAELGKVASYRLITSGGAVAGVDDASPRSLAFALAGGNPARGAAQVRLDLPGAAEASVVLYDVSGRVVRTLASGRLEAGRHLVNWDLRDESGAAVGDGVFFAACRVGEWRRVVRVMVVR